MDEEKRQHYQEIFAKGGRYSKPCARCLVLAGDLAMVREQFDQLKEYSNLLRTAGADLLAENGSLRAEVNRALESAESWKVNYNETRRVLETTELSLRDEKSKVRVPKGWKDQRLRSGEDTSGEDREEETNHDA